MGKYFVIVEGLLHELLNCAISSRAGLISIDNEDKLYSLCVTSITGFLQAENPKRSAGLIKVICGDFFYTASQEYLDYAAGNRACLNVANALHETTY